MKKTNEALKKLKRELAEFTKDEPITITMISPSRKQAEDIEL